LHGIDETNGWVYFSGTERSHIGGDVYRIKLNGSGLQRLTEAPGTHNANINPSFSLFIDTWSDATTPPQVRLYSSDGKLVRVIDENKVAALSQYKLSKPEFLQVKTRDGFVMEAMMIKPPDFDPKKKYPVFQHTYSGPHAPQVRIRVAKGRQSIRVHDLPEIPPRCDRSSPGQAHARDDAEVYCREPVDQYRER